VSIVELIYLIFDFFLSIFLMIYDFFKIFDDDK